MKIARYLLDIVPKAIESINYSNNQTFITTSLESLPKLVFFLKKHTLCNFKLLSDYVCMDFLTFNFNKRFYFFIVFLNVKSQTRLVVSCQTLSPFSTSLSGLFKSVNWLEREVWDMFGVFFSNHPDLRRILTDYGFSGFPLRKDFPVTGFVECRYNDSLKRIIFLDLSLVQEFRNMDLVNPWAEG